MTRGKLLKLLPLLVVLLIMLFSIRYYLDHKDDSKKTAVISVVVAPGDSSVSLNGKKGRRGDNKVIPGDYNVIVSRKGFASNTKKISAEAGKTTLIGVALVPNKNSTANWYQTHPNDAKIAQSITDPKYATVNPNPPAKPIYGLLPYVGAGGEFRIDTGPASSDSANPYVVVTAQTESAKQDAITWMKNLGYDPSKLNMHYVSGDPGAVSTSDSEE